ncbi:hypothetical protein GC163_22615 [bacterium]|nr:hypothetical protein [bacterium]
MSYPDHRLLACLAICLQMAGPAKAADPTPNAGTPLSMGLPTAAAHSPQPTVIVRGVGANSLGQVVGSPRTNSPRDEFQQRIQQVQQERMRQEFEAAHRPTAWQLQNPSGIQNRYGESQFHVNGYQAPNTYFGAEYRPWSNMSAPLFEPQQPPNIVPVPPLTQTEVMVAPYSYWGPQNNLWHQVSPAVGSPNPLGSWDIGPGW